MPLTKPRNETSIEQSWRYAVLKAELKNNQTYEKSIVTIVHRGVNGDHFRR